ncbi:hypothetical protein CRM22_008780 [Opisthorchis felineus]|uniref:DUF4743 domain-containing protein n=1 Tax=Opisthorchis felineus TaxID=147828 RepID=A0A4S2LA83_OPIFE|nr:hypothetical protein CRM22_008780 [Opisthorchis felineus]
MDGAEDATEGYMACLSLSRLWTLVSQRCNNFLLPGSSRSSCFKFVVDGFFLGLIRHDALSTLLSYPEVFVWTSDPITGEQCITLHPSLNTPYERTSAVADAMLDLRATGTVPALKGWRDEVSGSVASGCTLVIISFIQKLNGR